MINIIPRKRLKRNNLTAEPLYTYINKRIVFHGSVVGVLGWDGCYAGVQLFMKLEFVE